MRCLLFGHNPVRCEGKQDRAGRYAVICQTCGKTYEEGEIAPGFALSPREQRVSEAGR